MGQETKNGKQWASNYGIFQISSKYWCNNEETPDSANGCGIRCKDLLGNDLEPTIMCANKIVSEKGMEAWSSWVENCKGKWIGYFTYFCF
ncbi:lysozyme C-like isoform X2 [Pristis pectinata]|nr:lysozyme C-like isoform X2 [Pristis pectinata]XP_051871252.1 lysozyme C-like isoform X2 [Pristis pectinata]